MKNKIMYILLLLGFISYKAQTITLKQLSECQANLYPCPSYEYAKDTSNLLGKFVGIWKGTYTDGRTYEFRFTKKENDGDPNERKWDILIGKMIIKSSNGNTIYNSLNNNDLNSMNGYYFDQELKKYKMSFTANADCNDGGYIYISFPIPNNLNQMSLLFVQDRDIIQSCPSGYKTLIPDAKTITLTKQ
jgi:hypothetical protein